MYNNTIYWSNNTLTFFQVVEQNTEWYLPLLFLQILNITIKGILILSFSHNVTTLSQTDVTASTYWLQVDCFIFFIISLVSQSKIQKTLYLSPSSLYNLYRSIRVIIKNNNFLIEFCNIFWCFTQTFFYSIAGI